jgi:hypothetical protein
MRTNKIQPYILIIAALFSAGCVTFNVTKEYSLSSTTGKGLLVFSFTTSDDVKNPYLHYRNKNTGEKGEILRNTNRDPLDWESPPGRLVVLELGSGQYEFYSWAILYPSLGLTSVESRKDFSVPFAIVPGKATYVGNLHLRLIEEPLRYDFDVADKSERDLTLLRQQFVNIKDNDILKTVSRFHF